MPEPLRWDMTLPNGQPLRFDMGPEFRWDGNVPEHLFNQPTTAMAIDNQISLVFTAQDITDINAALAVLEDKLLPKLINLTVEQRRANPKIGDKTLAFDEKCQTYAAQRPELVPAFADTAELAKDRAAIAMAQPWLLKLAPLCEGLEDTVSLLYTDVYNFDLSLLNSVKQASKRGVPGADTIYEDLRQRFPGRPPAAPPAGGGGSPPNP